MERTPQPTEPSTGLLELRELREQRNRFAALLDLADGPQREELEAAIARLDAWIRERTRDAA
jgi:hypothetical protein